MSTLIESVRVVEYTNIDGNLSILKYNLFSTECHFFSACSTYTTQSTCDAVGPCFWDTSLSTAACVGQLNLSKLSDLQMPNCYIKYTGICMRAAHLKSDHF